ncbi:ornithine carbamoyltransferase [Candidatus Roizmanbacteria bacterium RIFCSPHIGHO2_02_FULL_37_13b]|uniref:Ornithine carbamoyltransferase n=1 Tax=Candidatus Roizmanbacteria bacterium RIFCSPLOWO2_02_FULL_36_11 TaxID=1802071 RepID=A0A1F7JGN4_9BACT|nr:MAG: ornithine carbamoyltransferase [Candidatus Roizmanbacteria bacterium RIFCSPHIGHO2_02_FULL_37_13b]OGK54774.1 MAG: ornithine carbamoyltransferase [Candidatus Roizmanbacteria bacterium RIFCSPLOWO2_02_FULL_36_11]
MRHLISLKEQSKKDLMDILTISAKIKEARKKGKLTDYLPNQTLIMLFEKTSTRTRLSFEAGMTELGGHAIFLDAKSTQLSIGTDIKDEIRAIMRYGQVLMYRAVKASNVTLSASLNQIPVIDACSEKYHPCQALGDMLTMIEHSNGLKQIKKVVWLGIENNVSNSLMTVCTKLGIRFVIVAPDVNKPSIDYELNKMADKTGLVERTLNLKSALKDADYVHTDTWMDMEFFKNGKVLPEFKKEYEGRIKTFMPYQLNGNLIDKYAPKAKIMHCMACHINYEITRDAVDHNNSIIFDQAENRMHAQKGIIMWLLQKEKLVK